MTCVWIAARFRVKAWLAAGPGFDSITFSVTFLLIYWKFYFLNENIFYRNGFCKSWIKNFNGDKWRTTFDNLWQLLDNLGMFWATLDNLEQLLTIVGQLTLVIITIINWPKLSKIVESWPKLLKACENEPKLPKVAKNCREICRNLPISFYQGSYSISVSRKMRKTKLESASTSTMYFFSNPCIRIRYTSWCDTSEEIFQRFVNNFLTAVWGTLPQYQGNTEAIHSHKRCSQWSLCNEIQATLSLDIPTEC